MRCFLHATLSAFVVLGTIACGGDKGTGDRAQLMPSPTPLATQIPTQPPPPETQNAYQINRLYFGSAEQQFGDLYLPEGSPGTPLGTLVLIHGGCWLNSYSLDLMHSLAEALVTRGYAVWNIEYRRLGSAGDWPVMFNDVATAIDYLRLIDFDYNLDLNRLTIVGHSAGGHLALWAGARRKISAGSDLYVASPLIPATVISLAGIADLRSSLCSNLTQTIINADDLDTQQLQSRLKNTSPIQMLPTGIRTILLSGERDSIVPPAGSQAYAEAAIRAGDASEHWILPDADHFYLIDPNRINIDDLVTALESPF